VDEYEYREYPEINGIKRYLFLATASLEDVIIPIVDVELSHIILFVMLTLLGLGVLKVNK
jgi:hypothetical protein